MAGARPYPSSGAPGESLNSGGWLAQQQNVSMGNVTPWIEQQARVAPLSQSLTMSALMDSEKKGEDPGSKSSSSEEENDDDVIPTAIVIKNIPFAIKKEQLLDVMTKLNLPLPYAFNYHFDNGVFRGLAFANFTSTSETSVVVNSLNGREIGGRRLRVEYKKMLPVAERERIEREKREKRGQLEEQHRSTSQTSLASLYSVASQPKQPSSQAQPAPPTADRVYAPTPNPALFSAPPANLDMNNPECLELYTQLVLFRDDKDKTPSELAYPSSLTPFQRHVIPLLCSFMGLIDDYDNGVVIVRRGGQVVPGGLMRSQSFSLLSSAPSSNVRYRQQSPRNNPINSLNNAIIGTHTGGSNISAASQMATGGSLPQPPMLHSTPSASNLAMLRGQARSMATSQFAAAQKLPSTPSPANEMRFQPFGNSQIVPQSSFQGLNNPSQVDQMFDNLSFQK